jgi:hypothetical protein
MPIQENEVRRLRDLHDEYVWEVNAAIQEGREDLVWRLVDDYLYQAMRAMTDAYTGACERPDCAMCGRPRQIRPRRAHWWRKVTGK